MWADIMERVCGCPHVAVDAVLQDHARHPVRDEDYPGMVAARGTSVAGRLYLDVGEPALQRLDAFEGEAYERIAVQVQLAEGRALDAWVYRVKPEFAAQLLAGEWSPATFEREGKARFLARYGGFSQAAVYNPGMTAALLESSLTSLPLIARGKVRENYAVGADRILMIASDRLSAFDVIMGEPIPGKGTLLTQMALFWFDKLTGIVPNHLTGDDPLSAVSSEAEKAQVRGRAMLVKRLKPLPVEAVVRGYLAGSGWAEYQKSGEVCGVKLPAGLRNASKLPAPIFTPATKAEMGDHDENISFDRMVEIIGVDLATRVRDISIALYQRAADYALTKGIIIADTKFEFGLDADGTLTLMDEVLTPDSSRYWPVDSYAEGSNPPSYDKQFVRDWLEQATVDGKPWGKTAPAPALPPEVIARTAAKYQEALERLTR